MRRCCIRSKTMYRKLLFFFACKTVNANAKVCWFVWMPWYFLFVFSAARKGRDVATSVTLSSFSAVWGIEKEDAENAFNRQKRKGLGKRDWVTNRRRPDFCGVQADRNLVKIDRNFNIPCNPVTPMASGSSGARRHIRSDYLLDCRGNKEKRKESRT